jgi:VWFA-related protein
VAVLEVGKGLRMTASLTQDLGRVPAAIASATTGGDAPEPVQRRDQGSATREAMTAALVATNNSVGVEGLDPAAAAKIRAPKGPAELKQLEIEARILTEADALHRQKLGQDSLYALLVIARALAGVEGRKTLLFFSEGLAVPDVVADVLDRMVSQANRTNLTIYAVDPRGLVPNGAYADSKRALLAARHSSERAMRSTGAEEGPNRGVTPMEVKTHDLALDTLRLNPQANLRELAEATGGFLVAETNDMDTAIERVGADLRTYYEVGYSPANRLADGAFRQIRVKLRRRGATIRTRRGYFASPPGQGSALPHELALAQALEEPELPRDFTHEVATGMGDTANGARSVEIVVRVPVRHLRLETDATSGYRAHFSVLVAVRNTQGALVATLVHDWPMQGAASETAYARQQSAAVRRTLALPPGRYVIETSVLDRLSGARSASRTAVEVGG